MLTNADGEFLPLSVGRAKYGFGVLGTSKDESGIALVSHGPLISNVCSIHCKTVVNLRDGAAVTH